MEVHVNLHWFTFEPNTPVNNPNHVLIGDQSLITLHHIDVAILVYMGDVGKSLDMKFSTDEKFIGAVDVNELNIGLIVWR